MFSLSLKCPPSNASCLHSSLSHLVITPQPPPPTGKQRISPTLFFLPLWMMFVRLWNSPKFVLTCKPQLHREQTLPPAALSSTEVYHNNVKSFLVLYTGFIKYVIILVEQVAVIKDAAGTVDAADECEESRILILLCIFSVGGGGQWVNIFLYKSCNSWQTRTTSNASVAFHVRFFKSHFCVFVFKPSGLSPCRVWNRWSKSFRNTQWKYNVILT